MLKKRIILLIFILAAIGASAYGVYKFSRSEKTVEIKPEEPKTQSNPAGLEYLTDEAVVSPILAFDNLSIWYFNKTDGELRRQHLTNKEDLKSYPLPAHDPINFALWPSAGSDFITSSGGKLFLFDSASNQFLPYPSEIKYLDWIVGGQKIAYVWTDAKGSVLSAATADNREHERIANLPSSGLRIAPTPNGKSFVVFSASEPKPIYFVTQGIGVLEPLTDARVVLRGKVSPDGKTFAFVSKAENNFNLYILNLPDTVVQDLGTISTPDAFAWTGDGSALYWADSTNVISKKTAGTVVNVSDLVPESQGTPISQIIAGTTDTEIFFIETDTGRLGRIQF